MIDSSEKSVSEHQAATVGNGSVAHQIIGQFVDALEKQQGFEQIAARLRTALFEGKPSESSLRAALFGDDAL